MEKWQYQYSEHNDIIHLVAIISVNTPDRGDIYNTKYEYQYIDGNIVYQNTFITINNGVSDRLLIR